MEELKETESQVAYSQVVDDTEKPVKKEEPKWKNIEPVKDTLSKESPLKRLVLPHKKTARLVTEADIERVVEEARVLHAICFESVAPYRGAYAMHHCQIDDKDPLSMFVTSNFRIILNPVIKRHSNYTNSSKEGCVTYPGREQAVVERWQKVDVEYVTIMVDPDNSDKFKLSSVIEDHFTGLEAKVFQHEFDHGNAKYIYSQDEIEEKPL